MVKHDNFGALYPSTVTDRNSLIIRFKIRNLNPQIFQPNPNDTFTMHNPYGIKLHTGL